MNIQRIVSVFAIATLVAGCAANVAEPKGAIDENLAFDDTDSPADSRTRHLEIRGTIGFGGSVESTFATTGFVGYTFTATGRSTVNIDLVSADADPVVYLYGPLRGTSWARYSSIASNDDSGDTFNSHITKRLSSAGTYLIVAREYFGDAGSFTLTLGCDGGECRAECGADDSCPTGSECHRVVCVRAPCPSWCEPVFTPPVGALCGTRGAATCAEGQFCDFGDGAGCGATDRGGHCATIPANGCSKELFQVCGCDNVTYDNTCYAHAAGVSVASTGACEPPPPVACGGRAGNTCAADEFCAFSAGAICGHADGQGVCTHRPEACITLYRPVCGCDGLTHSNSCAAGAAGTGVLHDGPCEPVDCRTTGCESGTCMGCRGPLPGPNYVCVPDGAVC